MGVWRVQCVHETMEPNRRIERQLNVSANMEIYRHRWKRQARQRWRNATFQLESLAVCVKRQKRKKRTEHNIIWINEKYPECGTVYLGSNGALFHSLSRSLSHICISINTKMRVWTCALVVSCIVLFCQRLPWNQPAKWRHTSCLGDIWIIVIPLAANFLFLHSTCEKNALKEQVKLCVTWNRIKPNKSNMHLRRRITSFYRVL